MIGFIENHFQDEFCWSMGIWVLFVRGKLNFILKKKQKERKSYLLLILYFLHFSINTKNKNMKKLKNTSFLFPFKKGHFLFLSSLIEHFNFLPFSHY